MKSFFPDVNVWIALVYDGHQQHSLALDWFLGLDSDVACFCRFTQLSFLRLLTNRVVMGDDVQSQRSAWDAYDLLAKDSRVSFQPETDPKAIESAIRKWTASKHASANQWPDAYLAAFAAVENLNLITFDRALGRLAQNAIVLS